MPALDTDGSRGLRVTEALAALLSAGVVVAGVVLALLMVVAPWLIHGTGLSTTDGPKPDRVLVQVGVGALGEWAHWKRSRLALRFRPAVAIAVVAAVLAALWWGWWR